MASRTLPAQIVRGDLVTLKTDTYGHTFAVLGQVLGTPSVWLVRRVDGTGRSVELTVRRCEIATCTRPDSLVVRTPDGSTVPGPEWPDAEPVADLGGFLPDGVGGPPDEPLIVDEKPQAPTLTWQVSDTGSGRERSACDRFGIARAAAAGGYVFQAVDFRVPHGSEGRLSPEGDREACVEWCEWRARMSVAHGVSGEAEVVDEQLVPF